MGFKTLTDAIPNAPQTELKFAGPSIIVAILFTFRPLTVNRWSILLTLERSGGEVVTTPPQPPFRFL